ncbi:MULTISPECIES: hypothetical protein [unclassified Streptomyces]|uniref:hypothetical protein n=1 Tax=unclassified Streptomyces TaxID=2593676 RepID=UPI0036E30FE7
MPTREPPGHLAPHIPAEAYHRAQATGQPVVIVATESTQTGTPWTRLLYPFAIAGAVVVGGWGLVAALCWLMEAAAHTATVIASVAGPVGVGGISLKLFGSKK